MLMNQTPGRESGASLVEVGLLLPLLILLAIGLSEIGFLVVDYMTVTNGAREGARTGAAAANYDIGSTDADDLILNAVEEAACNLSFGSLDSVTIYRADANGQIPVPPGNGVNVYVNNGALICGSPSHGHVRIRGLLPLDPVEQRQGASRAGCPRCRSRLLP